MRINDYQLESAKSTTYKDEHFENYATLGVLDIIPEQGRYLPLVLRDSIDPVSQQPMVFCTFIDQPELIDILNRHNGKSLLMIHPIKKSKFNYTLADGRPVQVIGAISVIAHGDESGAPTLVRTTKGEFVIG